MKKFKFNLESLLTMREWEARRTRQALAESSAHVTQLERRMKFLATEKSKTFSSWSANSDQPFTAADRQNMNSQLAELEGQVIEYKQQLNEAIAKRSQAMEDLSVATRRKRAVENLREKRVEEHRTEVFKQEAVEIEDIFNARRAIAAT